MKVHKNDEVIINAGKEKGKRGKVEKVLPKSDKIIVGGMNLYKRHVKPRGKDTPGGIIDLTKPLPVASVSVICPKCNQPTRIGYRLEGNEKYRVCKKCDQNI